MNLFNAKLGRCVFDQFRICNIMSIGSGSRQSTKPPRYKSENERRERSGKSKDDNRRNQRGSLKGNGTGGSGSGGDQGDEAWETTSEMSEQDDKDRDDLHETQRRNYSSGRHVSRGNGRRNSHSARYFIY